MWWKLEQTANYYRRQGSINPYADAIDELHLRKKIERFRDYASQRYLQRPTFQLDLIKQEWFDIALKPMAKSCEDGAADAKRLRAVIMNMPSSEVFYGDAKAAYERDSKADIEKCVAEVKSRQPTWWH